MAPQARAQTLQHLVQAVTGAQIVQQQTGTGTGICTVQFFRVQCAQMQVEHRGRQGQARQMFSQQPLQVGHVACGLCGAHHQLPLGGGVAPGVHGPAQLTGQHATLAHLQPHLQ